MKTLLLSILLIGFDSFAGDKINNGGGIWACISQQHEVIQAQLVDLYEAENEFGLQLINPPVTDVQAIVLMVMADVQKKFPDYYHTWSNILTDVNNRLHYVNSELQIVDDSLFRVKPLPSTCLTEWKYIQFANYTYYNEVLIRKDLWESPKVQPLDKAALVIHEVIYRWMRENFSDKDSVRARQIVGILFSTMTAQQSREAFGKILNPVTKPDPAKPVWICAFQNYNVAKTYFTYGKSEMLTRNSVYQECKNDNPTQPYSCNEFDIVCELIPANSTEVTCLVRNEVTDSQFVRTGRSKFEAQAKASRACEDAHPGDSVHCLEPVCE